MFDTASFHKLDVRCILVVEIGRNIASVVICYFPRCVRESVPDACSTSTFGDCTLILQTCWSACVKRETTLDCTSIDTKVNLSAH